MFQLACDPSGTVVETTLRELVPAVIKWGNKLDHILRVLLSHILGSSQVTSTKKKSAVWYLYVHHFLSSLIFPPFIL